MKYRYGSVLKLCACSAWLVVAMSGAIYAAQINTSGKLEILADDRSFSARITGRLFIDANFYHTDSEERRLTSGAFIRSARIGVTGNFREYEYEVEFDNATDQANLRNANIKRDIGPGKLSIGQFKISEGFDAVNSAIDLVFIERPYLADIVPGYKIGLGYKGTSKKMGYSTDVYNMREASDGESRPINAGVGAVARAYAAPINQKLLALHLGGSFAVEYTDSIGTLIRVSPIGRAEEYRNTEDFRFVLVDRQDERVTVNRFNLETAAVNGPLSVQAEYMNGRATSPTRSDDDFSTWYGHVSYILTGEARKYVFRRGRIHRPVPSRSAGAVEIAARYQQASRHQVANAKLTATEFGVTYYANQNVRFMLNYGVAHNKLIDDSPRLVSMRAQFDF
ncbi:MAG: Porin O [Elusimicrobia bacterium]|nr:Porin O [Elusimicrobiota bacterium]